MSAHRRNEVVLLHAAWMEEAFEDDGEASDTQVLARRAPRDSYTHDRPMLSASLDLPAHYAMDLEDLNPLLDDESRLFHSQPTVRPTGK